MAVPSQETAAVGQFIAASLWNDDVRDAVDFLTDVPRCSIYQTATTNMATSGTAALMLFDTEQYDSDGMHSTSSNTGRITATTAGLYSVRFNLAFAANATGIRTASLRKNGTEVTFARTPATSAGIAACGGAFDVYLAAGDYLELWGTQTSGGALASSAGASGTTMQARWVAAS